MKIKFDIKVGKETEAELVHLKLTPGWLHILH